MSDDHRFSKADKINCRNSTLCTPNSDQKNATELYAFGRDALYSMFTAAQTRVDDRSMGHGSNGSPKADGLHGTWINTR
jgi:hypothetical protein